MSILRPSGITFHNSVEELPRLDPEQLFKMKYANAVKNASGLELFAYKVLPASLLRSFVLTFDPRMKFQISPMKVTVGNRTRITTEMSPFSSTQLKMKLVRLTGNSLPHYNGITGYFGPIKWTPNDSESSSSVLKLPNPYRRSVDTTKRTRPVGSNHGTFEKFKYTVYSPARTLVKVFNSTGTSPGTYGSISYNIFRDRDIATHAPMGASISKSNIEFFRTSTTTFANSLLTTHGPKMLTSALPTARRYSLLRNVAELKDLPRSILSLRTAAFDLRQLERALFSPRERSDLLRRSANSLKDLPNEWLSYWFGWRTLYNDVLSIMKTPQKVASEINTLMSRSGKASSFRSFRRLKDSNSASPLFFYSASSIQLNTSLTGRVERESEIRLVINATFDFPRVDIPQFKKELFLKKLGVYPAISDVYELTPWSWLLDWFTGVGNYLELVETINNDPSLINYGFITAVVKANLIAEAKYKTRSLTVVQHHPAAASQTYTDTWYRHTSVLAAEVQVRKEISSILGVSRTSELSSLSSFQKSILGAILSQRVLPR